MPIEELCAPNMSLEEWLMAIPTGTKLIVKRMRHEIGDDEPALILECPDISQFYVVALLD